MKSVLERIGDLIRMVGPFCKSERAIEAFDEFERAFLKLKKVLQEF